MKLAIIGSRNITNIDIEKYLPEGVTEIVSGGAKGVDTLAKEYAKKHNIKYTEFLPDYSTYKKGAPLKRNRAIAEYADCCLAFWNGKSNGTEYTINCFNLLNKKIFTVIISNDL